MPLMIKPEEVLLPKQFLDEAQLHIDTLLNFQKEKLVLLGENVIPSIVMIRYDRLMKMLQVEQLQAKAKRERSELSKAESMLLTIRSRIHFFEGMNETEILDVLKRVDFLRLKREDTVFEQFTPGREIYYIIKGDVMISGYTEKGKAKDCHAGLTVLEEGQVFGELGPILGESRSARASVCSDDAFIMVMELKEEESPAFTKVYRNLMQSLARKLIKTNNQLYPFICD